MNCAKTKDKIFLAKLRNIPNKKKIRYSKLKKNKKNDFPKKIIINYIYLYVNENKIKK